MKTYKVTANLVEKSLVTYYVGAESVDEVRQIILNKTDKNFDLSDWVNIENIEMDFLDEESIEIEEIC